MTTLSISVPAALVIGAAYGAIAWYNPFIYINCLGILVAGGACRFVVRKGLLIGRIRSRSMSNSLSLFVGCVGLYASWLAYVMALFGGMVFIGPLTMWSFVVDIGAEGLWEVFEATPSGWVLYLIWLVEAVGLVLFCILVAVGEETPYCEDCQEWTTELESKVPLPYREIEKFHAALEAEKYGGLVKQIDQFRRCRILAPNADLPAREEPSRNVARGDECGRLRSWRQRLGEQQRRSHHRPTPWRFLR